MAEMMIDYLNLTGCSVIQDENVIMHSESDPVFDLNRKRVILEDVIISGMFLSQYLSSDFEIEIWESGMNEATSKFFDAGILSFEMIEVLPDNNVRVDKVVFEYDFGYDIHERLDEAELVQISTPNKEEPVEEGDHVTWSESYGPNAGKALTGVVKKIYSSNSVEIRLDDSNSTKYTSLSKLTRVIN